MGDYGDDGGTDHIIVGKKTTDKMFSVWEVELLFRYHKAMNKIPGMLEVVDVIPDRNCHMDLLGKSDDKW